MNERWLVPYWTDFRTVSNTSAAKAVILLPLIGYWIIFNDYVADYTRLSRYLFRHGAPDAAHFPWRLFIMYFGLCFVAVASALYQWRCPPDIKMYATATEYVGRVFPAISGIEQVRVEQALRDGDNSSRALHTQIASSVSLTTDPDTMARRRAHADRNMLQAYFDLCNRSSRWIRLLVAWCYRIGFAALLAPSIDVFWRVVAALVRSTL